VKINQVIRKINRNSGFTLIQTVVVIIVLGALAGMAIPRMITLTWKVKNQEALPVLHALLEAQFEYKRVNGTYTASLGNLDVTIPTLKNFENVTVYNAVLDELCVVEGHQMVASVHVTGATASNPYALFIIDDGTICCVVLNADSGLCSRMGFN